MESIQLSKIKGWSWNRGHDRGSRIMEIASDRRLTHVVENVFSCYGFLPYATLGKGDVLWNGFVQVMADL